MMVLQEKKVLVTGGGGFLGRHMVRGRASRAVIASTRLLGPNVT